MSDSSRGRAREGLGVLMGRYGTVLGLVVMVAVFSILRPNNFMTITNFLTIIKQGAILTIMASGLTVVLLMLDFDLSIGYLASLVGIITTGLMARQHLPVPAAIFAGCVVGLAAGLVNGLIVTRLRVSSLIATLGTGSIMVGLTFLYSRGAQISSGIPAGFVGIGRGSVFGVPNLVLIMAGFSFLLWLMSNHTETGRRMYAIGGNREAAWLSGINVGRHKTIGFAISGLGAAISGIMLASLIGVGHPQAADGMLLDAFTAAFLGAVTFRDGEFHVGGTVVGVLILSVALNGLTMVGAEFYVQNVIKGVILIAAVAAPGIRGRLSI